MDLEGGDGFWQMALDEALLELRRRGSIPDTIRVYRFCPSAVSIGYFQRLHDVVDVGECRRLGIDVVRRFTGGGAVYHDCEGEIVYSVALSITPELRRIEDSYRVICSAIVEALRRLGLEAEFRPINDVVVRGRKVSGSAQARRGEALLQHGTLMISTPIEVMDRVLRPLREKLASHGVSRVSERVTTIERELGYAPRREEVARILVEELCRALDAECFEDTLGREEIELARSLVEKYRSREWLERR